MTENKENRHNLPDDFMFQLTKKEFDNLIFHIGSSSWGGTRKLPNAFSEQGVAMLASVLHSDSRNKQNGKGSDSGRMIRIKKERPLSERSFHES